MLGEGHPETAHSLRHLGIILAARGDYTQATALHEQVLAIEQTALGEQHPDVAASQGNLTVLHQAIACGRQTLLGNSIPMSEVALAVCYATAGRTSEAWTLLQQAAAIDDRMVENIVAISSQRQRLAYLAILQGNQDAFLSLVLRRKASIVEAKDGTVPLYHDKLIPRLGYR